LEDKYVVKDTEIKGKADWRKIIGNFLLLTLILSIIYATVQIISSPSTVVEGAPHVKLKSDYVLMLIQCVLGIIVMTIPAILNRRWSFDIPNNMHMLYFVFLYCAIYLGEVRSFYYIIPQWDTVLHAFSGAMLGAFGFTLVSIFNNAEKVKVQLSPFFVALFAFCFALAIGALWEIYEYGMDEVLSLNMQKFALEDGTLLIGHEALDNTMKDMIVDSLSALMMTVYGFFSLKRQKQVKSIRIKNE